MTLQEYKNTIIAHLKTQYGDGCDESQILAACKASEEKCSRALRGLFESKILVVTFSGSNTMYYLREDASASGRAPNGEYYRNKP